MKKLTSIILTLIFVSAAMGFYDFSAAGAQKKPVTVTGIVMVKKNVVSLKTTKTIYTLTGQLKELMKMDKKEASVTGYANGKKFTVLSFHTVKKQLPATGKTTTTQAAATIKQKTSTLIGILTENELEGKHYELATKAGTFVLVGMDDTKLDNYAGKTVKVTGRILENQMSIYQRGGLFSITSIEVVSDEVLPIKDTTTKEPILELTGTLAVDKVKGTHIALLVDDLVYGLSGNVTGLEKLDGKKVKIKGHAPDVRYIRAPDFILFEVDSFGEAQ